MLDAKRLAGLGTSDFLRECFRQMDDTDTTGPEPRRVAGKPSCDDASSEVVQSTAAMPTGPTHNPKDSQCRCAGCLEYARMYADYLENRAKEQ